MICRESIKQLWLECRDTDESENESFYCMWFSKLEPMKDHNVLQAHLCVIRANQKPTAVYVQIEDSERRKVSND